MDQETRVFLEEGFREVSRKIDGLGGELRAEMSQGLGGLREEMSQGLSGLREEMREGDRQTRIMMDGLRSDVQLVAEGLMGMSDRMARHEAEVQKSLKEMTMLFIPSYQLLDTRVKFLEEWVERQARDVLDVVREKFGKPEGTAL